MRGKVSRVILVCTILIALSYAWWPFQKDDEKPKSSGYGGYGQSKKVKNSPSSRSQSR